MSVLTGKVARSLEMIDRIKEKNNEQIELFVKEHPWMAFFISYKPVVYMTISGILAIIGYAVKARF